MQSHPADLRENGRRQAERYLIPPISLLALSLNLKPNNQLSLFHPGAMVKFI